MAAKCITYLVIVIAWLLCLNVHAQTRPSESVFEAPGQEMWLGSYGNFRLSEKLFWAGEFHYRMAGTDNTPYVGKLSKIYNRHGIQYLFSKKFSMTAGGVLRLNFDTKSKNPEAQMLVLEPRIYHEYVFFTPVSTRLLAYHRLRFEHRWSRPNLVDSKYIYRTRYRYFFMMKIPLNKPTLGPGTFYANPGAELIMQSGESVIDSPLEDLRLYPLFGYVASPRLSYSVGATYSISQNMDNGAVYGTRWLIRANVYIALDLRKFEEKIPEIKVRD